MKTNIKNANDYIAGFPKDVQTLLKTLQTAIKKAAPKAEEVISYGMPAYKYNGMLAYFAGYKNHIGFYPTASGIANFKKEISEYKNSKGAIQFPIDKPLPIALINKIVKFRMKENSEKLKAKSKNISDKKTLRTCSNGHKYYKSSDCPVCPICEKQRVPEQDFLATLSAPARRALENAGITKLNQLAKLSEAQVLKLHGMGPGSLPKLREALKQNGFAFKK